jgi:hypothetical protein
MQDVQTPKNKPLSQVFKTTLKFPFFTFNFERQRGTNMGFEAFRAVTAQSV